MTALAALRCGVAAAVAFLITRTWTDPDLWGHLKFGADIVARRAVPRADSYSFTSDKPWVNHEWLAEVLTHAFWAAAGPFGIIALKASLTFGALAAVLASLRRSHLSPTAHDSLVLLVVAGLFPRTHVMRPQVFTIALFAALLLVFLAVRRGNRHAVLWIPPLFVLWVNLHGGWIVGLAVALFWMGATMLRERAEPLLRKRLIATAIASVAATLINPYGWKLWGFIGETVRFERAEILDWQPIWRLPPVGYVPWLATAALCAWLIGRRAQRVDPLFLVITVLAGIASLFVGRLDAFFLLSTVMLLPPVTSGSSTPPTSPATIAPAVAIAAAVLLGVAAQPRYSCVLMDGTWQPEPEAVGVMKAQHISGRMLSFFDWGQYAIWHLSPQIQVSIDGRRETVYSQRVIDTHLAIYRNDPDAPALVEQFAADIAWLPSNFGVTAALERHGWTAIFKGPVSTVLVRRSGSTFTPSAPWTGTTPRRCFPGP